MDPAQPPGIGRHERHFHSPCGQRNIRFCFRILFLVDRNSDLGLGTCGYFGDCIAEGGVWATRGNRNNRRLPHGQSARLPDWSDTGTSRPKGAIKDRYLATIPTMTQASVARTTLPHTRGTKNLQLNLDHPSAGSSAGQMSSWESPPGRGCCRARSLPPGTHWLCHRGENRLDMDNHSVSCTTLWCSAPTLDSTYVKTAKTSIVAIGISNGKERRRPSALLID